MKKCSSCEYENPTYADVCASCGAELMNQPSETDLSLPFFELLAICLITPFLFYWLFDVAAFLHMPNDRFSDLGIVCLPSLGFVYGRFRRVNASCLWLFAAWISGSFILTLLGIELVKSNYIHANYKLIVVWPFMIALSGFVLLCVGVGSWLRRRKARVA